MRSGMLLALGLTVGMVPARTGTDRPAGRSDNRAEDLFYVPGTLGTDPATGALAEGVEGQVRRALANVRELLRQNGMDLNDVVSSNVYLSDSRHFSAMNAVYREHFPTDPPTRATVQADLPVPGALVQLSMIAARPGVNRTVVVPDGMRTPELPYSWGIMAGNTLFVAGATSRNPETYQPQSGDVGAQTRQVLENIGSVLRGAGLTHRAVTACKVFLADGRDFQAMNAVWREFFPEAPPARATVRAQLMNPVFSTEIQCQATREERRVVLPPGQTTSRTPYSPAILAGNRLYLSGFVGRGPDGYGDVRDQTRVVLDRLRATLAGADLTFDRVEHATIIVTDIRQARAVTEVYESIVGTSGPPLVTVGMPLMSAQALVEIMMTAGR